MPSPFAPAAKTKVSDDRRRDAATPPLPNALAFRIPEVPLMGGPRRTTIYALAAAGHLRLIRIGRRTLVDGDSLRKLLREGIIQS
jgi:hypothetical protein